MVSLPLIFLGLFFLYLTRRKMTVELARLVQKFGGGHRAFVWLWSLIFLPGTIIHEVSHFLAAALTGAKTGKVEIFPSFDRLRIKETNSNDKSNIHLGYVQTQQLNPIRGFLVGMAPLLTGLGLLIWISSVSSYRLPITVYQLLAFYLFFTMANSLFPSWADVKQTLPLIIIGIILGRILWLTGVQIKIGPESPIWGMMTSLKNALMVSVAINAGIVIILWGINRIINK